MLLGRVIRIHGCLRHFSFSGNRIDRGSFVTASEENLARTNLTATTVVADALTYDGGPFDAILLDAPCSATGTIRRHPDLPYVKTQTGIKDLVALQRALMTRALLRCSLKSAPSPRKYLVTGGCSGFQTQLHCFRPLCERVLKHTRAIGAPGIDQLRWLRPWYPGETLDVTVAVVSKRRSSKREDRGYIGLELHAEASGAPTFAMQWVFMILTRQGAQPGGNPVTG